MFGVHEADCDASRALSAVLARRRLSALEANAGSYPEDRWSARGQERGLLYRELPADGGKRSGDKCSATGECHCTQLSSRIVAMVQHVIHLGEQIQITRQMIIRAGVQHGVAGRFPRTKVD